MHTVIINSFAHAHINLHTRVRDRDKVMGCVSLRCYDPCKGPVTLAGVYYSADDL